MKGKVKAIERHVEVRSSLLNKLFVCWMHDIQTIVW